MLTIDLYHFIICDSDLGLGWGALGQWKAKTFGLSCPLSTDQFEIWCGVKEHFKFNILILLLSKVYVVRGNNCCSITCIRNLQCWHVFEWLLTNLIQTLVIMNTYELYIWILAYVTLTLIQCHRNARHYCILHFDTILNCVDLYSKYVDLYSKSHFVLGSKIPSTHFLAKFSIDLDEILYVTMACSAETLARFISHDIHIYIFVYIYKLNSRDRTLLTLWEYL